MTTYCLEPDRLFSTVGVHPTRCRAFDESPSGPEDYFSTLLSTAEEGIKLGKVVAVGECGLGENDAPCYLIPLCSLILFV